jgi:hypothetical protein
MQEQHEETNRMMMQEMVQLKQTNVQLLRKTQELAIELKNLIDQHNSVNE